MGAAGSLELAVLIGGSGAVKANRGRLLLSEGLVLPKEFSGTGA